MSCSECKWWGRHLVGANFSLSHKKAANCSNPDLPSNLYFQPSHVERVTENFILWTYEDFECKDFNQKKDK